ncbi:helix-turn-helix domain-containing protein [Aneurinibacillus thermoaerophilus]|uniref:Helix-turn-helix domain-containing protein n=1 Tax=Aneurinibacillus thermoaerophilus TaxID=143495 RepID=A0A1G8EIG1_ANETH|nr:helix-turn-helix transcriptional regulator [Aneurinibacillus thermoaerophilus]MED0736273.1 helix-turn-helix transcriptional regulator [Aneurinibacillus thermoaerophilus]SDH69666.1 Helix-turn-helix domain-containing protein [Aneurinibacillus thermoaerophilus]
MKKLDLQKIRNRREELRITQEEMARFLGYKTATGYSYIENGRCKIDPDKLPLLSKKLQFKNIEELYSAYENTKMVQKTNSA